MEHQFVVENIKCEGCESTIKKALKKIPGVKQVVVNIEQATVTVKGNANSSAVISKLYSLGYPQKNLNSVLLKAKSYFSCAVGKLRKKSNKNSTDDQQIL